MNPLPYFRINNEVDKGNLILNPGTLQRVYFSHGYVLLQPSKGDADVQVKQYVYVLPVLIGLLMSKKAEFLRDPLLRRLNLKKIS